MARYNSELYQEMGPLPIGRHDLSFTVTIERGEDSNLGAIGLPAMTVWDGKIVFPVNVVPTIDEVLPPVHDRQLDEDVAKSLSIQRFSFTRDGNRGIGYALVFGGDRSSSGTLRGVVVGLEAELWHEEKLIETQRFVAKVDDRANRANSEKRRLRGSAPFEEMPLDLRGDREDRQDWYFKVRATTEGVLSAWEASNRWKGEFSISVDTLFRRER